MGIFSRNKGNDELMLVFDIGSSSVGGMLFRTQSSGVPKIVIAVREPIVMQKSLDVDRFLSFTLKALEIVAGKIYMAKLGAPTRIFCVLSSIWHISQTRVIKLEKNAPFIFSAKLADDLIKKEITLFEEEHAAKLMDSHIAFRSIEFKNIKTMLNGYETTKPLNQKAKEVEITVFISIGEELVLGKIEDTVKRFFNFKEITFSSFLITSFTAVRDMQVHNKDFLLIDIGGEVTDIAMVKKNTLRESISFPLGLNFIIRGVASSLHSTLTEAKSLIYLFKDGHATVAMTKKLEPIISKLKAEWLHKFQESLANLSNDISIPATIYMVIDKDLADFLSETIKSEQFNQYTLTEAKFKVIFLGTEIFHGMAAFEGNELRDPGLIIDSIYINRFLTNPALLEQI